MSTVQIPWILFFRLLNRTSPTLSLYVLVNKYFINKQKTYNIQKLQASSILNSDTALPANYLQSLAGSGFENSIISLNSNKNVCHNALICVFCADMLIAPATGAPYVQHADAIQPLEQNQFCFWLQTFCLVEPKVYNIFAAHNLDP